MDNMHKELMAHFYIMTLIKRAIAEQRHFYGRKENQDEYAETEISFLEITDNNFYFLCNNPEKLNVHEQEELLVNFSVREKNKLLPCEIKVRVTKFRLANGALFFSTTFPVGINHMQRRLFVRYPVKTDCLQHLSLSFTNKDYALQEHWQPIEPECINWGDISIGGIMFYLKKHACWNKQLNNNSTLIVNCIFNNPQNAADSNPKNMFYIACEILEMQNIKETNLKFIRARFTNWTYQSFPNWRKIHNGQGIEAVAKYLFQYAYKNKIATN